MRILAIILISGVVGTALGGAVAYVEEGRSAAKVTSPEAGASVEAKVPQVQVDEPTFNFGTMQRGTDKEHEFLIKNVGKQPLTLGGAHTTCPLCTVAHVTDQPIPPGGTTYVRLKWSARVPSGPFRKSAMVKTNDPAQPEITLNVEGQVMEASGVSPPDLAFDKITAGESKSAEVYVMAMLHDQLEVTEPTILDERTRDKYDVQVERVAKDQLPNPAAKDGVRVKVTAKPGLPVGHFNTWLALRTNMPEAEKLEIPINGQVVGDINVRGIAWDETQGLLRLGSVASSTGKSDTVNLVVRGPEAADVKFSVESCDPPELKVSVGKPKVLKPGLVHVPVTVEVRAGTRPMVRLDTAQGEAGRVVLKTTHPAVPELVLGVRFSVER